MRSATILFIQTEGVRISRRALQTLCSHQDLKKNKVIVLCRSEDAIDLGKINGIHRIFKWEKGNFFSNWIILFTLKRLNPSVVSAVLSKRDVYRKARLCLLLFLRHQILVFDSSLKYSIGRINNLSILSKIFYFNPFSSKKKRYSRILVVQSEHRALVRKSIKKLLGADLYPEACLDLLCKEQDMVSLSSLPGIKVVHNFPKHLFTWILLARKIRKRKPDFINIIFSGRPVFSFHKLFIFLVFPFRSKLIFNAGLDCYWFNPRSLPNLFRKEPLLIESKGGQQAQALLIQTESTSNTLKALHHLLSHTTIPKENIFLLCSTKDRHHYLSLIPEENLDCWTSNHSINNYRLFIKLLKSHNIVAAVLSGRPIFRLQKLLFFLLPARERLVYNENLDYFYIRRSSLGRSLQLPSIPFSFCTQRKKLSIRKAGKFILWTPRFFYLLCWIAFEKVKSAKRLAKT